VKFLTLVQPWASLIAEGHKSIETRGYSTKYRGPLAIHAGKAKLPKCDRCHGHGIVPSGPDYGVDCCPECGGCGHITVGEDVVNFDTMPRGVVLAVADLVDVFPMVYPDDPIGQKGHLLIEGRHDREAMLLCRPSMAWHTTGNVRHEHFEFVTTDVRSERPYGGYDSGRYAWVLENVRRIEPVPMKGALGIQDVPGLALTQILAQILP